VPRKETMAYKHKKVDEIKEIFGSNGVYLFDYRGLTVAQMEILRNRVREFGAKVKVIKNRYAIKYFESENLNYGREVFHGPMAAAYADEKFVEVAKIMVDFEKEMDKVEIKAAFIEKTFANKNKVIEVSKLPSKNELLATLAFSIGMPLRKMGFALNAPLRNMLILMKNLKDKKEKEEKQ